MAVLMMFGWMFYKIGEQEFDGNMWSVFRKKPTIITLTKNGIRKLASEADNLKWEHWEALLKELLSFMDLENDKNDTNWTDSDKKNG